MAATHSQRSRDEGGPRRFAVITGASSGIGRAFAARLARDAYDLVVVARRRERLEELAKQVSEAHAVAVEVVAADLTDPGALRELEDRVAAMHTLELLVNNAGFGTAGRFWELDPDREEREIRLNVIAPVRLTRAALPGMIERGHGAIINVSSVVAFQPVPYDATYGATKTYVNSFTEALHEELRGTGVRVQALCPGATRTEFQEHAGLDASRLPSFAWQSPEEVVEASLEGLRRGQLVCVPGIGNRLLSAVSRATPHALTRRLAGELTRRVTRSERRS